MGKEQFSPGQKIERRKFLGSVAALGAPFVGRSKAPDSSHAQAEQNYQAIGDKALSLLKWDWRKLLPGWQIKFQEGKIGKLGEAEKNERVIYIWIRAGQSPESVSGIIAHELAHAFDWVCMDDSKRAEWIYIRKLPFSTVWYPKEGSKDDYDSGAGDFAECVAWIFQGKVNRFRSRLGLPPNKEQQALIKKWIGV